MRPLAPLLCLVLAGCAELSELRAPPKLSAVRPDLEYDARPIPKPVSHHASTWSKAGTNLFADRVALSPGDVLTVLIAINDNARLANRSDRSRTVGRSLNANGTIAAGSLQGTGTGEAGLGSTTEFDGTGGTQRSERIRLSLAAVVIDVLPNGNLSVEGRQEVRVNDELRVLTIAGLVRPADIGPDNVVAYERIAEARISYGGRGPVQEVQRPPYGQRVLDHVLPF